MQLLCAIEVEPKNQTLPLFLRKYWEVVVTVGRRGEEDSKQEGNREREGYKSVQEMSCQRWERLPTATQPPIYTDISPPSSPPPSSPSTRSRSQSHCASDSYPPSTYQPSITSYGSRTEVDSEPEDGFDGVSLWGGTSEPSSALSRGDAARSAARDQLVIQLLTRVTMLEGRLDAQGPQPKEELDLESQSLIMQGRTRWASASPARRLERIITAVAVLVFMFGISFILVLILVLKRQ